MDGKIKETFIKSTKEDKKSNGWESGISVLRRMEVIIPVKLLLVCNEIADKVRNDEFSIVCNCVLEGKTLQLSEEYYIPKQVVTSSSIEYQKDEYQFNTVIHRHPDGCHSFSSTDHEYINQNFQLSILYTKESGFVTGLYNLKHDDFIIPIPCEIYVDYDLEIDISNIKKPEPLIVVDHTRRFKRRQNESKDKPKSDLDLVVKHEWDSDKDKLLPEEKFDYSMMRELLLEEVNEQIWDHEHRIGTLEESMYYMDSFSGPEKPF